MDSKTNSDIYVSLQCNVYLQCYPQNNNLLQFCSRLVHMTIRQNIAFNFMSVQLIKYMKSN